MIEGSQYHSVELVIKLPRIQGTSVILRELQLQSKPADLLNNSLYCYLELLQLTFFPWA